MPKTISSQSAHSPEHLLAAAVLFSAAATFCLPVPVFEDVALPWWATRIGIGNVLLHELLFIVWIGLYGQRFLLRAFLNGGIPTHQAALWLVALALWCGAISLSAPLPLQDFGRTLRLVLNAALLFAVVRWTRQTDDFTLGVLNLGFFTGTLINLIVTFDNPFIVNEVMRLAGQNTPGVAMAVAIHLSAWLFYRTSRWTVQAFTVLSTVVFTFGCGISYSRVGWFVTALGLIAWFYVLIAARPREEADRLRLGKARRTWLPVFAMGSIAFLALPQVQEGLEWVLTLIEQKFSPEQGGESNLRRIVYVVGVAEIMTSHPLGVGYSGFFDAMTATDVYRSEQAATEEDYEANPHSTFLYYASAGGIPGAVMCIAVFVMLINSMRFGLVSALGSPGRALFALAMLSFLLIGLAVPYLFNSIILIAPVGIAAGWGWTRRSQQAQRNALDHDHADETLRPPRESPALS